MKVTKRFNSLGDGNMNFLKTIFSVITYYEIYLINFKILPKWCISKSRELFEITIDHRNWAYMKKS